MKIEFGTYLTKYFGDYLPNQRGVSSNTIKSYRDTFIQLIDFMKVECGIQCNKLSITDFTTKRICAFLSYLEIKRKISVSSRNQRLSAIHSFFCYLQRQELACYELCSAILSIEFKKTPAVPIHYLSLKEVELLFSLPNQRNKNEFRDLTLLTLLYETGARVQELIDLQRGNIFLTTCPTIILRGKGNKSRTVPIGNEMTAILKKYFDDNTIADRDQFLFTNKQGKKLTRAGVGYILSKYINRGREIDISLFKGNIKNHSMRHSKAMHLLEAGVNLIYIRDFLGHTSVTTTEIYAKSNAEVKRKAIEEHSAALNLKASYSLAEKETLLDWLKSKC